MWAVLFGICLWLCIDRFAEEWVHALFICYLEIICTCIVQWLFLDSAASVLASVGTFAVCHLSLKLIAAVVNRAIYFN